MTEKFYCNKVSWEGIMQNSRGLKTFKMSQVWNKIKQQNTQRAGVCLLIISKSELCVEVDTTAKLVLFIKGSTKGSPEWNTDM